jgi:aspartate/methionine/tyrosine aminotransferase
VRNCHLIVSQEVSKFIVARASHSVMPSFFSLAVAMAAYELGYKEASRSIVEPTNASRVALKEYLDQNRFTYILRKGYHAFIRVTSWVEAAGWQDSEPISQYLAEEHGVAVVPGAYFSPYGSEWIRFSYATPPERTLGAVQRFHEGLSALEAG